MALIKCPECNADISDMAKTCPQCGYPISKKEDNVDKRKKRKKGSVIFSIIAVIIVVIVIICIAANKKNNTSDRKEYLHAATKQITHSSINLRIPVGWKETTAGESYVRGRTFYLFDCYIAENEDDAVAELFITDRIPSASYGVSSESAFESKNKKLRKDIFERDWREYFKKDLGSIVFDGEDDCLELPGGIKGYHCTFSLDGEVNGTGDYVSFFRNGTVYMITFYHNEATEYDYSNAFKNIIDSLEIK